METKYCEYCKREIPFISNKMYNDIIVFCNNECITEYNKDRIKEDIWQIIRDNIDTAREIVLN